MSKCFLIASYIDGNPMALLDLQEGDQIFCADGGYAQLSETGLQPDLIIGDMDSLSIPPPPGIELHRLPVEKDDTDTLAALKEAIRRGFRDIVLIGGLGGRLDHTVANLHCLSYALEAGVRPEIRGEQNRAFLFGPSRIRIPRAPGFGLSLFSYTDSCCGISSQGLYYPLKNATLTCSFPLGISNRFTAEEAVIDFTRGKLLVILSRDK